MSARTRVDDVGGGVGVLAPLRIEQRTALPLARAGWRVVRCGVGAAPAEAAARGLLASGAQRLLVWGVAGGLDPALTTGALVLPERVVGPRGERVALDAGWRAALLERLGPGRPIRGGALASAVHPIATRAGKLALAARTVAAAVDLEAAAVAGVAACEGIPCAVLRAVVDPLGMALPQVVLAASRDRFPAPGIALRLLFRPGDLTGVLRLYRAFRTARGALWNAAHALAASAPGARAR